MFWKNFYNLCTKNNISPNAIAKILGISSGAITRWKQENSIPRYSTIKQIADYFGVEPDELLKEQKNKPSLSAAPSLTEKEKELLNGFRELNEQGQQALLATLSGLSAQSIYKKDYTDNVQRKNA